MLSVLFVPPAAEYSTELKKMENKELMSVFGIIGSVFTEEIFCF